MPDGDRFRLGLTRSWARVQRSMAGGDPIDRTADLLVRAAAAHFRKEGGIGDLGRLVSSTTPRKQGSIADVALDLDRMASRQRMTTALAMAWGDRLALTSDARATEALVRRVVAATILDQLDRMVSVLVGPNSFTASQLYEHMQKLLSTAQFEKLCKRLMEDPSAKKLRAPNRVFKPLATSDLLGTQLEDI